MARVQINHATRAAGAVLEVTLSERNLIVLLSKLYTPGSACTIGVGDVPDEFDTAWLRAEPDELHYAFPTREGTPAGPMHPLAEAVLIAVRQAIAEVMSQAPGRSGAGPVLGREAWEDMP